MLESWIARQGGAADEQGVGVRIGFVVLARAHQRDAVAARAQTMRQAPCTVKATPLTSGG